MRIFDNVRDRKALENNEKEALARESENNVHERMEPEPSRGDVPDNKEPLPKEEDKMSSKKSKGK